MMRITRPTRLLALPCLLLVTACGPHAKLDVSMRSVAITVPRVLAPAVALVAPPPVPLPVALPLPPLPPLPVPLPPPTPGVVQVPIPPPPSPACPVADQLAAPDKVAGITVKAPPVPGTFVQNSLGSYGGSSATPKAGSLVGTSTTTITALPSATSVAGQQLDAWSVTRTNPVTRASSVEVYQLVGPSGAVDATAPGIYLTGLRWDDPVRGPVTFHPTGGGVEIIPLPVTLATADAPQFASSQTDPATGTTLALAGQVSGKARVDVCGRIVDTYTLTLTGALTSPGQSRQVAWRMQLAPQYGGVQVEDQLVLTDAVSGFTWDRTLRDTAVPADRP